MNNTLREIIINAELLDTRYGYEKLGQSILNSTCEIRDLERKLFGKLEFSPIFYKKELQDLVEDFIYTFYLLNNKYKIIKYSSDISDFINSTINNEITKKIEEIISEKIEKIIREDRQEVFIYSDDYFKHEGFKFNLEVDKITRKEYNTITKEYTIYANNRLFNTYKIEFDLDSEIGKKYSDLIDENNFKSLLNLKIELDKTFLSKSVEYKIK